ncbi:MAG: hypothetical protein QM765_52560 [Myxococcales bacterium]
MRAFSTDAAGGLHLLVHDPETGELVHVKRPLGATWTREVLASDGADVCVSLLDHQGEFAYCRCEEGATLNSYTTRCYRKSSGGWVVLPIAANSQQPLRLSGAAFDGADRLHVLGMRALPGGSWGVTLWGEAGSGFVATGVARAPDLALSNLAFDSKDVAHLAVSDFFRVYELEVTP